MKRLVLVIALCLILVCSAIVSAEVVPFDFPDEAVRGIAEVNLVIFNGGTHTEEPAAINHMSAVLARLGIRVNPAAAVRLEVNIFFTPHPQYPPVSAVLVEVMAIREGNLIWKANAIGPAVGPPSQTLIMAVELVLTSFGQDVSGRKPPGPNDVEV